MHFIRKVVVIKLRSMGDTILMTAALSELQKACPDAEIHAVVTEAWAPLLENHPAIHRVWTWQRRKETAARAKAVLRMAISLRREHYDTALCFHASPSSATLAFGTGAKTRSIHFHGHKDKNRYSTVVVPGKGTLKPIIERDMDTVRALGFEIPAGAMPKIYLHGTEISQAQALVAQRGLKGPVLALGLGASRPSKSWPIDRFAALACSWVQNQNGSVLAFTGPGEEPLAHSFLKAVDDALMTTVPDQTQRAALRKVIGCQQGLPLRQVAALLKVSDVFLGNDSGLKHLGVAVGTPTVTLFGPEHPFEWHPYPQDLHPYFFIEGLACRKDSMPGMPAWCGVEVCVEQEHRCMKQIGIEPVLEKCQSLLGKKERT